METDDGFTLTEGPAIVQYVADKFPNAKLAPPNGSKERYQAQEWLNFITSELHKNFGALVVANGIDFRLERGARHALIGPNGAGKTTLFNLLTGFIPPDTGMVELDGHALGGLRPYQIVNRGLARTFQLARPFMGMTVL